MSTIFYKLYSKSQQLWGNSSSVSDPDRWYFNVAGHQCFWLLSQDRAQIVLEMPYLAPALKAAVFTYDRKEGNDRSPGIGLLEVQSGWNPGSWPFEQVLASLVTILERERLRTQPAVIRNLLQASIE